MTDHLLALDPLSTLESGPLYYFLADWPYEEYGAGVVFNGAKIGYTHFSLAPADQKEFTIRSEALLHFRFLMFEKELISDPSTEWRPI